LTRATSSCVRKPRPIPDWFEITTALRPSARSLRIAAASRDQLDLVRFFGNPFSTMIVPSRSRRRRREEAEFISIATS